VQNARARNALLTAAAMCCFAANSLLCRTALRPGLIDAPTFMNVRFVSGAIVLALLASRGAGGRGPLREGTFRGAIWLALYAIAFSFAYLRLPAGAGALILFGVVQLTMTAWGIARGERPSRLEWLGLAVALSGLLALTLPGLSAPDPIGALLMAAAGFGWAFYSLHGKKAKDPVASNAGHFLRVLPFTLAVSVAFAGSAHAEPRGIALALASGALASGVGYAIWYAALRGLSSTQAGVVQLSVPALAAGGGVLLLGESLSPRLAGSGTAILAGILIAKLSR
jgi:drug/metabolite transporter (DMT)-like permease